MMRDRRGFGRAKPKLFGLLAPLALYAGAPASAESFVLTYNGLVHAGDTLTAAGGSADLITADTPFIFSATFDTSGPNLVAPLPRPGVGSGFVAYAPSAASITIGGLEYGFTNIGTSAGVSVAIFDRSNVIFPGRYGVGMIVNPLADGAGFIGDFLSASPNFSATDLTSTTFGNFAGVGVSPGIGCGPDPAPCQPAAIGITRGGRSYSLLYAGNAAVDYNNETASAFLAAVPEPATWAMMILGFGVAGRAVRRRRAAARPAFAS